MLDKSALLTLLGVSLAVCITRAEDRTYRRCIVSEKKICKERYTGQGNGINEEQCKVLCDGDKNCNFIFWNTGFDNTGFCAFFETCDELKDSEEVGTIFAKQGNACSGESTTSSTTKIISTAVPECKCDDRGTQKSVEYGDWCWTKNDPCKLLTGQEGSWNWVRCHYNGNPTSQELIKCPRDNPEFYRFLHHGHCKTGHVCNWRSCNTVEATIMDCRNRCESLGKHVGYFAYVPGSRCACYTQCENDGRHQDHSSFAIVRPECETAEVGPGEGSKTISMKPGYQCPKLVDNNNWMDGHTWPDKFSVAQTKNEIRVSRTDSTDGWGMNLRFQCCKDKCGTDFAYHSGDMVNENSPANTPEVCQRQCEAIPTCKFWDFRNGNCNLRANSGPRGKIAQIGYSYGTKHCSIQKLECHDQMDWLKCLEFGGPCCLNNGHCTDTVQSSVRRPVIGGNICSCPSGYIGQYCEIDICADYCLNGATCSVDVTGARKCSCPLEKIYGLHYMGTIEVVQYKGARCEIPVCGSDWQCCMRYEECALNYEELTHEHTEYFCYNSERLAGEATHLVHGLNTDEWYRMVYGIRMVHDQCYKRYRDFDCTNSPDKPSECAPPLKMFVERIVKLEPSGTNLWNLWNN